MGGWKNISVRLSADVRGYAASMAAAAGATKQLGSEFTSTAARIDTRAKQVTAGAGKLLLGIGLVASLVLGATAKAVMGFDKAMSGVSAVTNEGAASMGQLRDAALEAGEATSFTARQAAEAEAELVRAGISVRDVLGGGLRGALDLAAAGQLDLKQSAIITAQALNVFQLRGSQASRVADVLAAGANKSAADVHQLGEALRMGGLVARQMGLSLEETTGILSLFADNALIGSDAGTSLKTMLQRLVPQSKEAAAMMSHLGLDFFDARGQFIGIAETAQLLKTRLGGLSQQQRLTALTTIFGADAIRSANILTEEGAAGVRQYTKDVTDWGAAQRMAAKQLDNLAGDVEKFRGSLETAFIKGGSSATGVLRGITQGATAAVNGFNNLPPAAQQAGVAVTGVTAALGLAGGAFLLLGPKVKQAITLYQELTTTAPRLAAALRIGAVGLGVLGGALLIGTLALSAYGAEKARTKQATDDFARAIKAETEGVKGATTALIAQDLARFKVLESGRKIGVTADAIGKAIRGTEAEWARFRTGLTSRDFGEDTDLDQARNIVAARVLDLREKYQSGKVAASEMNEAVAALGGETGKMGGVASGAADGVGDLNEQMLRNEERAKANKEHIENLTSAVRTFLGASAALEVVGKTAAEQASAALEERHLAEKDALQERQQRQRDAVAESTRNAQKEGADVNAEVDRALSRRQELEERALSARQEGERKAATERTGTLAAFAEQLEAQVRAARDWQKNLLVVARRFGPEAAQAMAALGKEGAAKVAELASAAEPLGKRVAEALRADAETAGEEAGATLDAGFKVMATLASQGGQNIADQFLARLREGKVGLGQVLAEYMAILTDIVLVKPDGSVTKGFPGKVVASPTNKPGQQRGSGGVLFEAEGDVLPPRRRRSGEANIERHEAVVSRGGTIRVWNEPETGGESYIPLAPTKRKRSTKILERTAELFGLSVAPRRRRRHQVDAFADGGLTPPAEEALARRGLGRFGMPAAPLQPAPTPAETVHRPDAPAHDPARPGFNVLGLPTPSLGFTYDGEPVREGQVLGRQESDRHRSAHPARRRRPRRSRHAAAMDLGQVASGPPVESFAVGGIRPRRSAAPARRARLEEDRVPFVSPSGAKLVRFSPERAEYADGRVFTVAGWNDIRRPGGMRFRPAVKLDPSQVIDLRDETTEPYLWRRTPQGPPVRYEADGDVLPAGKPERHDATIARGGKVRVWAEPEAGGESYIPHHPANRNRSTAVLRSTAELFGLQVTSYAQGGIEGAPGLPVRPGAPSETRSAGQDGARFAVAPSPGLDALLAEVQALRAAVTSMPATTIDASVHAEFKRADITYNELDYLSRQQASRLARVTRR